MAALDCLLRLATIIQSCCKLVQLMMKSVTVMNKSLFTKKNANSKENIDKGCPSLYETEIAKVPGYAVYFLQRIFLELSWATS